MIIINLRMKYLIKRQKIKKLVNESDISEFIKSTNLDGKIKN